MKQFGIISAWENKQISNRIKPLLTDIVKEQGVCELILTYKFDFEKLIEKRSKQTHCNFSNCGQPFHRVRYFYMHKKKYFCCRCRYQGIYSYVLQKREEWSLAKSKKILFG